MGVQNICPDEDAQSSDSPLGPFFDAADPPVIVDHVSSESEDELEEFFIDRDGRRGLEDPRQSEFTAPTATLRPGFRFSFDALPMYILPGWRHRIHGHRNDPTNVIPSPPPSSSVNEAIVNEDKQSHQTKNIPTKSRRANIGKKKARRFENARRLDILGGGGYYMYDDSEYLSINCPFKFTKVLKNDKLADKVLNATPDDLDEYYDDKELTKHSRRKRVTELAETIVLGPLSPHHAFDNLDPSQKSFITRSHVPRGMIEYLEASVRSFFEDKPTGTYVSPPLTSFERMILHCIAQYYALDSRSFEHGDERLTKVTNSLISFNPPSVSFSCYVEKEFWKRLQPDSGSKRCRSRRQWC